MRFIIGLLVACLLSTCRVGGDDYNRPQNIINEGKFTLILSEVYMAESISGLNIKNVQGQQFDTVYAFNPFKDHNVTRASFDSSLVFYSKHPTKFKELLDKAIEKITQNQAMRDMNLLNKK